MDENTLLLQEKNNFENEAAPGKTQELINNVKTKDTKQSPAVDLFEDDLYVWNLLLLVDKKKG
jgi:hypothetical protein